MPLLAPVISTIVGAMTYLYVMKEKRKTFELWTRKGGISDLVIDTGHYLRVLCLYRSLHLLRNQNHSQSQSCMVSKQ